MNIPPPSTNPAVFTIPAGADFLGAVAACLLREAQASKNPNDLGAMRVFLPTRRAARALEQRLLENSGEQALLLPPITPLGDVSQLEELDPLSQNAGDVFGAPAAAPPSVLSNAERQFHLARLILHWSEQNEHSPAHITTSPAQAAGLALELGALLDAAETEGVDLTKLDALTPESYTENWQKILQFLHIITEYWPRILAEKGRISETTKRDKDLRTLTEKWRKQPPQDLVIAAGSTGSIPATAELLKCIASLPRGQVILPGLDLDMDADIWENLHWEHPQHSLKRLLETLGLHRAQVRPWQHDVPPQNASAKARAHLLRLTFHPAANIDRWQEAFTSPDIIAASRDALKGLQLLEAPARREEAGMIAVLLRELLDTPDARGALITPDRELALWVSGELRRWGVEIDDSAGAPFLNSEAMRFTRLLGETVSDKLAPASLLALLKHPLTSLSFHRRRLQSMTALMERHLLRGLQPQAGINGLHSALSDIKNHLNERARPSEKQAKEIKCLLNALAESFKPLQTLARDELHPLKTWLNAHMLAVEAFAVTHQGIPPPIAELADFFSDLLQLLENDPTPLPPLSLRQYLDLLEQLASTRRASTQSWKTHPRLFIWGLPEARMQRVDLVILGGLNEDVWPSKISANPWLNRAMMEKLGLRDPQWRIGHSAHDFVQGAMQSRVILSRALKIDGTPTMKSRWLWRLETLLRGMGIQHIGADAQFSARLLERYRALDGETRDMSAKPCKPPEPRPPIAARPLKFTVTGIEKLIADPYAIFARDILRLKPLQPVQAEFDALQRGTLLHAIMADFTRTYPRELPPDIASIFLNFVDKRLQPLHKSQPQLAALLRPTLEILARRFADFEKWRRKQGMHLLTEAEGEISLNIHGKTHTLTCHADRIEIAADNGVTICDYKSGSLPSSKKEVLPGWRPQLLLEALMMERGGFADINASQARLDGLLYIQARGREKLAEELKTREITACDKTDAALRQAVTETGAKLENLLRYWLEADSPYLCRPWRNSDAKEYPSDYDHLARLQEWSSADTGESEEQ